jgi:Uri superfamily endonuclease
MGPLGALKTTSVIINHIIICGDNLKSGAYILWLAAARDVALSFGRFRGGRVYELPAGSYAYVGSAMGTRGATALAGRLLRHATRSGGRPPQAIRDELAEQLAAVGLRSSDDPLPTAKRLRWHIDYLLDEPAVEIIHITIARASVHLEGKLARWLAAQPGVAPVAAGLGASDAPGETHLLRLPEDLDKVIEEWYAEWEWAMRLYRRPVTPTRPRDNQ